MRVSILVVDDETDVAELFRQCFRREARNGTYVLHFAYSSILAIVMSFAPMPASVLAPVRTSGLNRSREARRPPRRLTDCRARH